MAATSKARKNSKESNAKKTKTQSKTAKRKNVPAPEPMEVPVTVFSKEANALIYLIIGVLLIIGWFTKDGSLILWLKDFTSGLLGWSYFLLGPICVLIAVIYFFQGERPVGFRVICALLLPAAVSGFLSLVFYNPPAMPNDLNGRLSILFSSGKVYQSGGVIGSGLAIFLENTISRIGSILVLLVLVLLFFGVAFHLSATGLRDSIKKQYDKEFYSNRKPALHSKPEPESIPAVSRRKQDKQEKQPVRPSFSVDIPMHDEESLMDEVGKEQEEITPRKVKLHRSEKATVYTDENVSKLPNREIDGFVPITGRKKTEALEESAVIAPEIKPVLHTPAIRQEIPAEKVKKEDPVIEIPQEVSKPGSENLHSTSNLPAETEYVYPPVELLRENTIGTVDGKDEIAANRERLQGALRSFGINANIVSITRGPTVTRYDIELEQGVKLARVTNLAGDLALALGVVNVRIAPIPDRISTVGIEVPNKIVSTVFLRDIISSQQFQNAKSKISFALGKDIGGDCIVGNIAKLPHLLIAGTTGSGKSVCMNSLILSLLFKGSPDEVKLIMIDPKMVELGIYNGIPHLYVPVVTDPKKAAGALQWSVVEMLKRYRAFSETGVRDLQSYNAIQKQNGEEPLPQVVIVIDELADLMMIASKEVEESICRVAQMGRAAGMHLIVATQRPSADVITGLMKANIPSRIAFAVSSSMESRIILDQGGAEKLVGMGDMLFAPVGCGKPTRVQGAFVSDEEREDVINFIKEHTAAAEKNAEIESYMNKASEAKNEEAKTESSSGISSEYDEMLPQAVEAVLENKDKGCSVSMLQRRVKLGYARAARIVDQMEELGIVGPYEGAKPRKVLVDFQGWNEIKIKLGLPGSDVPMIDSIDDESSDELI